MNPFTYANWVLTGLGGITGMLRQLLGSKHAVSQGMVDSLGAHIESLMMVHQAWQQSVQQGTHTPPEGK